MMGTPPQAAGRRGGGAGERGKGGLWPGPQTPSSPGSIPSLAVRGRLLAPPPLPPSPSSSDSCSEASPSAPMFCPLLSHSARCACSCCVGHPLFGEPHALPPLMTLLRLQPSPPPTSPAAPPPFPLLSRKGRPSGMRDGGPLGWAGGTSEPTGVTTTAPLPSAVRCAVWGVLAGAWGSCPATQLLSRACNDERQVRYCALLSQRFHAAVMQVTLSECTEAICKPLWRL